MLASKCSVTFFIVLVFSPLLLLGGKVGGIVRSADLNEPLEKVRVAVASTTEGGPVHRTDTDSLGRFELPEVPPGKYLLTVSAVGYGLVKNEIEALELDPLELEVFLSPGTLLSNEVMVSADVAQSGRELTQAEIGRLKSVFSDDAFRAMQQLPYFASNDDFNSGFAVQGSGFDRVGVVLDGIPVQTFLHTIQGTEDSGSTSLLSAEMLEGIDVVNSSTSSEWTGASAGFLRLRSRTGNRSRWHNVASVSGSAFLVVSEGPLATGSWIASARKSYIDWIVRRIDPSAELNFGFYDLFGKVSLARGDKQLFSFSVLHGSTGLHNVEERLGLNTIDRGEVTSSIAHGEWSAFLSDKVTTSSHFYWQNRESLNRNRDGRNIWEDDLTIFGFRNSWEFQPTSRLGLSAALTLEKWKNRNREDYFSWASGQWGTKSSYDRPASRQEASFQGRVGLTSRLSLLGGIAWNHTAAVGEGYPAYFAGAEFTPSRQHQLGLYWGRSGQFPFFYELFGEYGNAGLRPERARNLQARWSFRSDRAYFLDVNAYLRSRSEVPWRPEGLWRLEDGEITPPSSLPYENVLEDSSRGAGFLAGRRVSLGLGGWLGYAWGSSRWTEPTGERFPGNYEQPHGFSLFGYNRWSSDFEVSFKWKSSRGLPIPAYVKAVGGSYFLSDERNRERLPDYHRIDVRGAKSFNRDRYRFTLFVEIVNLLGNDNYRFSGFGSGDVDPGTGEVDDLIQKQFPFLPTAGIIVEF